MWRWSVVAIYYFFHGIGAGGVEGCRHCLQTLGSRLMQHLQLCHSYLPKSISQKVHPPSWSYRQMCRRLKIYNSQTKQKRKNPTTATDPAGVTKTRRLQSLIWILEVMGNSGTGCRFFQTKFILSDYDTTGVRHLQKRSKIVDCYCGYFKR